MMSVSSPLLSIFLFLSIFFVATVVHASLGFGTALVAMPLLVLLIDVQTATPLVAFAMLTTTLILLWGNWRNIDVRAVKQLLLSSVLGIPTGIVMMTGVPATIVKSTLGWVLVAFSLYSLLQPHLTTITHPAWAYIFGFFGGVLGGAYNTNGPPLVLYGALRRWPPQRFRATLQGYFVPASVLIWAGHGLSGLWTQQVIQLYLCVLPVILLAIPLGTKLHNRIPAERFERLLYMLLIGLGMFLLFSAMRATA